MQIALTVISWFILLLQKWVNFPEKLSYDSEKCRTGKLNEFLALEGKFKALSSLIIPDEFWSEEDVDNWKNTTSDDYN